MKASLNNQMNMLTERQNTPETVRRDAKAPSHIRVSSQAQVIQFTQGGQEQGHLLGYNEQEDALYDPENPRELLTSEIDLISRIDRFRSSTTSLNGLITEQRPLE